MFVRRSPSGELIATGSINHAKLAQLRAAEKKPRKVVPKSEEPVAEDHPAAGPPEVEPTVQPKAEPTVQPKVGPTFKSALDTKH
jgi:S-DNA-T family DNA segregation ATPase FtsK/SpoIIIE